MAGEEHRPPPDVAEQTRAGFIEQLARELLAGADSLKPGRLLVTASTLLGIAAGGADRISAAATLVRGRRRHLWTAAAEDPALRQSPVHVDPTAPHRSRHQ